MLVWAWSGDVSAVSADLPSRLWNAVALARDEANIFHRALHYTEVPAAIGVVRRSGALLVTKLSVEFLVLTAARSGEVRFASWEEMDPEARTWVISMKAGREHRVPLQDRALAILEEARPLGCGPGWFFRGRRGTLWI